MAALQLLDVTHRYGAHTALDGVSLRVEPGDCYGFIGHNGAGKTTALRLALGLAPLQRGRILVEGWDATRFPREARARMGGLIEVPGFHGHLTARANLDLLARLGGLDRREARREGPRVLELLGLGADADRAVRGFSQGMRQRLGIAQALLGRPPILLLDEPTNGLDPEGIAELRSLLARLVAEEETTVMLSSHRLEDLAGLCNRVGVLRRGRLLVEEETASLLRGDGVFDLRTDRDDAARDLLVARGWSVEDGRSGTDTGLGVRVGEGEPGDVARALVEAGLALRSFAPRTPSLEEIYLRRLGDAPTDAASAPTEERQGRAPAATRAPAAPIARVARYEAARVLARGRTALLLLLPALAGVLAVGGRWRAVRAEEAEIEAGTLATTTAVTAFEGFGVALQAGLPLAALVLAGLASQALAGELARGTLRNVLLRPVRRVHVVAGKALAHLGLTLAGLGLLLAGSLGAASLAFDFGDVEEILPNGLVFPLVEAAELWPELRAILPSPVAPLAALVAVGFLAGAVARTPVAALALALGALVTLDLGRVVARPLGLEAWVPSAHLPSPLGDTSVLATYVDISRGVSNARPPASQSPEVPCLLALGLALALALWFLSRRSVP